MTLRLFTTDELVRIAAAGGGFRLDANLRPVDDLVRIASAARAGGATVIFFGLALRHVDDLVRISSSGRGFVLLED